MRLIMLCMPVRGVRAFRQGKYPGTIGIVHSFTPVNGVDDTVNTGSCAMRIIIATTGFWILPPRRNSVDLLSELSKTYDLSMIKPAQHTDYQRLHR